MPPKTGKNEESREKSRAALLRAGADLLVEHALQNPFAALRLRAICERAGYSTGAFYLHWASVDEYYNALAELLAAEDQDNADFATLEEIAESSADASALTAIARVSDRDFQTLVGSSLYDAGELLNLTWGRTHLRSQIAHRYQMWDQATGQLYEKILASRGREPRPPLDWDRIGTILQGLIEGLGLRHKVDPIAASASSEPESGLYAKAVAALLAVLTRPVGDNASLEEAIQALLP